MSSNSNRRDNNGGHPQDQQLPPIRVHLRDVWDQHLDTRHIVAPSSHTSYPSHVYHTSSYVPQSQTPRNDNGRSQPGNTYTSRSHPSEPTTGGPYAMYSLDLEQQRTSHNPNFPRITRASGDGRRYQCPECPERFDRQSALEIHMRSHTQERPFVCSQCGKSFTVKSNLRRHERTHSATSGFVPIDETHGTGGSSSRGHYSSTPSGSANQSSSKFYSSYRR